jgi:glycerol-3-phosphate dehydrogenase (NAD(P)+)
MKAAVLGAGSWGTALAAVLTNNGHETVVWAKRAVVCDEINTSHTNRKYLPEAKLPVQLRATTDLADALADRDLVIFAVPSGAMPEVVTASKSLIGESSLVAHAVKGFDLDTRQRMSQLIAREIPDVERRLAVITGPSHAEEVIAEMPTTIVVAAYERTTAETVQDALMNSYFRVYTNPDVVGAELGGCLKNIIALSVGMADGLGFGDNAKAALMTRGLAEITRLGMKLGASPLTFAGLSGIGDLIVTCTSRHSRNFRAGRLIGQGRSLEQALEEIGMVVEGIRATQAALTLAQEHGVEMPITKALHEVLFLGKQPHDAVEELMGRERGHEMEEVARQIIPPSWS